MPPAFTHLTDCPAPESKDTVDSCIDIRDCEVQVPAILDRFAFGDALQDEPRCACERPNGYILPVGPGWTGFLTEQRAPERRGPLDIAHIEDDLHREDHGWLGHVSTAFLLMASNAGNALPPKARAPVEPNAKFQPLPETGAQRTL
jgi:hypothetical protein